MKPPLPGLPQHTHTYRDINLVFHPLYTKEQMVAYGRKAQEDAVASERQFQRDKRRQAEKEED